ncbi:hypothetical protein BDFB_000155 [Asbolus verrucosus]|uniref:Uncharacterized protein n=1 Tax=Asbolus verrucosus TaxID=1661398 RepID=A0A482VUB9_ASBVE|nr:hypothetical protein BDFB_000155 [Asbolus verrucosus]
MQNVKLSIIWHLVLAYPDILVILSDIVIYHHQLNPSHSLPILANLTLADQTVNAVKSTNKQSAHAYQIT